MYRLFLPHFLLRFRVMFLLSVLFFAHPLSSQAGCGCDKPPPMAASVRPNVTYGGMPVTLFHASLRTGVTYNVTFTTMEGQSKTVSARPVNQRDLADGVTKNQLVVPVPKTLALGPASITVEQSGQTGALLAIPDTSFTVAPQPVAIPSQVGSFSYNNYKAAVGRDGTVYISVDVTDMVNPRTFRAQAKGYPLRFTTDDATFYNTQGFLMQLLDASIPGLTSTASSTSADSDLLNYSRHEFNTYFLQHAENLPHATDPADGNWHLDGTRHMDHNHVILAIAGKVNGTAPAPGTTPAFTLRLKLATLFDNGLVGLTAVTLRDTASTDSFRSTDWNFSPWTAGQGDVLTNGTLFTSWRSRIDGDVTAASIIGSGQITGRKTITSTITNVLSVTIPDGIENIGAITLSNGATRTLGTGSYVVTGISIGTGSGLVINNSMGPVTLYVTGQINVSGNGSITMTDPTPERFAIYVVNASSVTFSGSGRLYGLLYAPLSMVKLSGYSDIYGSLVGLSMTLQDTADVHYDVALRGQ